MSLEVLHKRRSQQSSDIIPKRAAETSFYDEADVWMYLPLNGNSNEIIQDFPILVEEDIVYSDGGASFNGSTSKIRIADASHYKETQTVMFWVKNETSDSGFVLVTGSSWGFEIIITSQKVNFFTVYDGNSFNADTGTMTDYDDDALNHVAVVFDKEGGFLRVCINGILKAETPIHTGGTLRGTGYVTLGYSTQHSGGNHLNHFLSDFIVFKRSLTDTEILEAATI